MAALSREHGPLVQLLSCLKLLEYLRNLPEDKPESEEQREEKRRENLCNSFFSRCS